MPGANAGYSPAAYAQAGLQYGQGMTNLTPGQKRDSSYDQVSWQLICCLLYARFCIAEPMILSSNKLLTKPAGDTQR